MKPLPRAMLALLLALAPVSLWAQEFVPPDQRGRRPTDPPRPEAEPQQPRAAEPRGFVIGVLAFSTRAGGQLNEDEQVVLGSTVDLVQLGTPRLRARAAFEVGFGAPAKSLGLGAEVVYRFRDDAATAIPYLGAGAGYYDDDSAERVWPTVVFGFELPFRRSMSWLVEVHTLDGVQRMRALVGLATRGGGR